MPYQVEFLDIQKVEQYVDELRALTRISSFIKPNQKQFKEANESLMSAYLDKFDDEGKMKFFKVLMDKFSDEDKAKALEIITNILNHQYGKEKTINIS